MNGIEKTVKCKAKQISQNGGSLYVKRDVLVKIICKKTLQEVKSASQHKAQNLRDKHPKDPKPYRRR